MLPALLLALVLTLSSAGAVTVYGYQEGLAKADRTAGRLVTQDTGILDAVRRAEAQVAVQQFFDAMAEIRGVTVKAPVKIGQTILENLCGTGVALVATAGLDERKK